MTDTSDARDVADNAADRASALETTETTDQTVYGTRRSELDDICRRLARAAVQPIALAVTLGGIRLTTEDVSRIEAVVRAMIEEAVEKEPR